MAIEGGTSALTPGQGTSGRRRWWPAVLGGALLVAAIGGMALAARPIVGTAVSALGHLDWPWIPLGLLAQASSLAGFARAQRRLLRVGGLDVHLLSVMAVTYAGNAISLSLPVVGAEASAVFTFRQYRARGASAALAGWELAVSGVLSTFAFALMLAGGAIASHSPAMAALGLAAAATALAPLAGVLLATRSRRIRELISGMSAWALGLLRPLRVRSAADPRQAVESVLGRIATLTIPPRDYLAVFAFLLWNWVAECLCLAISIQATGAPVPWHGLFLAYAVGASAVTVSPTPGGVGMVEVTLSAALAAAGLPGAHAVAAVVVYRLISFWLVAAVGWAALAALGRSRGNRDLVRP